MAQKVLVEMIDDLDGETATQTVPFGLDGVTYEIDLSDTNATRLREALARFVDAGTRTGGRKIRLATGQTASVSSQLDREKSRRIREWALAQGYEVSARGRLAGEIVDAYETAQAAPVVVEKPAVKAAVKRGPRKKATAKS
ncbi:Lsr2 family protein [Amycolatopsis sp. NPDC059657]|uniref:histone-like nucleoid-structuring protein Lsr2 n=1 Tax=Amycolatopsis sp. NPDC059657 TaxID=3346899 RepID=UPI00366D9BAC